MAPSPGSENLSPPAGTREAAATERDSLELLESLLDLTLNVFTELDVVGSRELRPAGAVRRLLASLRQFPAPLEGSMVDRLRAAVVARRGEILAGIARQATVIARRLGRDRSPASVALHDLWRQVGSLAGPSTKLDLRTLSRELNAATSGPLRDHVGHGDPVRFRDDILVLRGGDEHERTRVLKRWAAQIAQMWSPKDPRVIQRLQEDRQPAKLKLDAVYAGLFEALTDNNDRPQRVKLGKQWVKDNARPIDYPGPMRVKPERYLTRWWGPEQYWLWLRRQAIARAEQYILGLPEEKGVADRARSVKRYKDSLRTRTAIPEGLPVKLDPDRLSREDLESVNVPLGDDEVDAGLEQDPRRARLEKLFATATPEERALLNAWKRHPKGHEAPSTELAEDLGKTPVAVRKTKERLLRRASQL